jgi:geranylgeranyl pyrophosphate synthase
VPHLELLEDWVPSELAMDDASGPVGPDLVDDAALRDLLSDLHADEVLRDRANIPRIRPILVALAARASGADQVDGEIQHAAELLHLALGFHDLALGREGGKRRRMMRRVVRRSVGWLGGNTLTLRALELVRATRPDALADVVDTLREFAEGHALAQEIVDGRLPSEDDWSDHADSHTGALFAFCCRAGASVSGGGPEASMSLGRYGRHLGRVWHVAEDVAALVHGPAGRHLAARASAGRPVFPVIVAMERDPSVAGAWRALVRRPEPAAAEALAAKVVTPASIGASRELMLTESLAARRALHDLPASRYRTAMEKLAVSLVVATPG